MFDEKKLATNKRGEGARCVQDDQKDDRANLKGTPHLRILRLANADQEINILVANSVSFNKNLNKNWL